MGALRQPRLDQTSNKKPPVSEKLDQYGRDPQSLSERMRVRTDYEKGEGWAPSFFAMWADLPRLSSGAVCFAFIGIVQQLSFGRPRASKSPWHEWTEPISAADMAELCRANVRDIQRQLSELKDRGMIGVKIIKQAGAVRYSLSLLLSKWRELEDYAVWKRRQVVEIDSVGDEADTEQDEEFTPISKDAVHLFKRPASVRPGRATRAAKVSVGVREFVVENHSPTVDLECTAVITSGRLVVSACVNKGESETKGEQKENAERHPCRAVPANRGSQNPPTNGGSTKPARADEIISLFDPLLKKSGVRLISPDLSSLRLACAELGGMPHDFLVHFVMVGGRGSRPISGPRAVASIVKEARLNWETRSDPRAELRDVLSHPNHYTQDELRAAREKLAELER